VEFDELVEHFKDMRQQLAATPVPYYPPSIICFTGDEVLCSITGPKPSPSVISNLLAIVPVIKPEVVFMVMEVYVRKVTSPLPISDDPEATPALAMFHVENGGPARTRIEAFQVLDDGSPEWVDYPQDLPIVPLILGVIRQMQEADVTNSVQAVVQWFQLNNYGVRIHPKFLEE
jgi:hypothetical protein